MKELQQQHQTSTLWQEQGQVSRRQNNLPCDKLFYLWTSTKRYHPKLGWIFSHQSTQSGWFFRWGSLLKWFICGKLTLKPAAGVGHLFNRPSSDNLSQTDSLVGFHGDGCQVNIKHPSLIYSQVWNKRRTQEISWIWSLSGWHQHLESWFHIPMRPTRGQKMKGKSQSIEWSDGYPYNLCF